MVASHRQSIVEPFKGCMRALPMVCFAFLGTRPYARLEMAWVTIMGLGKKVLPPDRVVPAHAARVGFTDCEMSSHTEIF